MQSYKSVFYQKERNIFGDYNLTLSESFCLTDLEKQIQKVRGTLKSLPKIVSKRSQQEECVYSAKAAKCVAPCVASQVLHATDKLPSFPGKAEFSQIER